jgi:hypothetical protein
MQPGYAVAWTDFGGTAEPARVRQATGKEPECAAGQYSRQIFTPIGVIQLEIVVRIHVCINPGKPCISLDARKKVAFLPAKSALFVRYDQCVDYGTA